MKKRTIGKIAACALTLGLVIPTQSFAAESTPDRVGETKVFPKAKMGISSTGLQVTNMSSLTPEDLVRKIVGNNVQISNIRLSGVSHSSGIFTGGDGILGFNDGIVLSSGNVGFAVGPNSSNSITEQNGLGGDIDLNTLITGTQDATYLEFDFIPRTDTIKFQYVFSSDEYTEYAGTAYNDVFGFFVNGKNVAVIPGTQTPVSINNVNHYSYSEYFINNMDGHVNSEMDGLTTVLPIEATVNKNQVNHIKLAIADVGDSSYDSNVFIKAGSFSDNPNEIFGEGYLQSEAGQTRQFGLTVNKATSEEWMAKLNFVDASRKGYYMISGNGPISDMNFIANNTGMEFTVPVNVTKLSFPVVIGKALAKVRVIDNGQAGDTFELNIISGSAAGYTTGESVVINGQVSVIY
ncbi:choice-of-anchor L domain-containing protein [Neobacillus niacini]|uniref:choice-of-anchor L domain-containing protein n=1 Tax=Neobacillus niacini TaxID=86668 RepID=UPI0039835064